VRSYAESGSCWTRRPVRLFRPCTFVVAALSFHHRGQVPEPTHDVAQLWFTSSCLSSPGPQNRAAPYGPSRRPPGTRLRRGAGTLDAPDRTHLANRRSPRRPTTFSATNNAPHVPPNLPSTTNGKGCALPRSTKPPRQQFLQWHHLGKRPTNFLFFV